MTGLLSLHPRIRLVGFLLAATFIAVFGLYIISGFWIPSDAGRIHALSEGWNIRLNDQPLEEDRIDYAVERAPQRGDVYLCSITLPEGERLAPALKVYSRHSILDCYLDEQLFYTYGASYLVRDGFVPKGFHLIPLPEDYPGRTLTLRFTAGEKQAFSSLHTPLIGNTNDLFRHWIRDSRAVIPVSVFLILFGFLLSMLSAFLRAFDENNRVVFGGLVSMNAGLFAICYYDAFFFITQNLWFTTVTGYLAQFLLPVALSLFLRRITDDEQELRVFNICCLFNSFLILLAVILQLLHFYPLTRSLYFYQYISAFTCAVMVAFGCRILYRSNLQILRMQDSTVSSSQRVSLTSQSIMIAAVFMMLFAIFVNAVLALVFRRLSGSTATFSNLTLLAGLVAYAALMMLSFFFHGVRVTHENYQQTRLTNLAYTDTLTGLPNRAFCYHALRELDESNEEYCVMSLDVNYLKKTNDTQGHAAGDALLVQFAEELRSCFRASDIIGRLGGDEFIVILKGASLSECLLKAKQLTRKLPFSFSYGCAHSKERSTRYGFGIYRLADQRMYEMKQEMHKKDE